MPPMLMCSVSRSVEEAARDDEWPGAPLVRLQQTRLSAHSRPAPAAPTPAPAPARAATKVAALITAGPAPPAPAAASPPRRMETRAAARERRA